MSVLRLGLCSVTLRTAPADRVAEVAAAGGLAAIEWGADVHAPPGDHAALGNVRRCTEAAGLAVASYGSYLRLAGDADRYAAVLDAAVAIGAPRIRVWAGELGSRQATADDRHAVVRSARELAVRAADAGVTIGFEFHGGTLTDTAESALRLLEEVDRPDVGTYWQPPQSMPADDALAGLDLLEPHVVGVHVFSWWPGDHRLALDARAELWTQVLARLSRRTVTTDLLLEFVPADEPAAVIRDAGVLRDWIGQLGARKGKVRRVPRPRSGRY